MNRAFANHGTCCYQYLSTCIQIHELMRGRTRRPGLLRRGRRLRGSQEVGLGSQKPRRSSPRRAAGVGGSSSEQGAAGGTGVHPSFSTCVQMQCGAPANAQTLHRCSVSSTVHLVAPAECVAHACPRDKRLSMMQKRCKPPSFAQRGLEQGHYCRLCPFAALKGTRTNPLTKMCRFLPKTPRPFEHTFSRTCSPTHRTL